MRAPAISGMPRGTMPKPSGNFSGSAAECTRFARRDDEEDESARDTEIADRNIQRAKNILTEKKGRRAQIAPPVSVPLPRDALPLRRGDAHAQPEKERGQTDGIDRNEERDKNA